MLKAVATVTTAAAFYSLQCRHRPHRIQVAVQSVQPATMAAPCKVPFNDLLAQACMLQVLGARCGASSAARWRLGGTCCSPATGGTPGLSVLWQGVRDSERQPPCSCMWCAIRHHASLTARKPACSSSSQTEILHPPAPLTLPSAHNCPSAHNGMQHGGVRGGVQPGWHHGGGTPARPGHRTAPEAEARARVRVGWEGEGRVLRPRAAGLEVLPQPRLAPPLPQHGCTTHLLALPTYCLENLYKLPFECRYSLELRVASGYAAAAEQLVTGCCPATRRREAHWRAGEQEGSAAGAAGVVGAASAVGGAGEAAAAAGGGVCEEAEEAVHLSFAIPQHQADLPALFAALEQGR